LVFFLVLAGIFQKDGGLVFSGNSGGVGRTYLLVMAPIFKGQPELMAIIPSFNNSTTCLTSTLTQPLPVFPRRQRANLVQTSFSFPFSSSFSFSFSSSFFLVHRQWLLLQGDQREDVEEPSPAREVLLLLVGDRRETQRIMVTVLTLF
jgi:hypothetical protein